MDPCKKKKLKIFTTQCCRPEISKAMNSVRSNKLEYQRFTPSGYKDIEIRKIEKLKNIYIYIYM